MTHTRRFLVGLMSLPVLLLALLFAGCATSEHQADVSAAPPPAAAPQVQEKPMEAQAPPAPVEETRVAEAEAPPPEPPPPPPPPPPPAAPLPEPLDLYFDFDRYQLKANDAEKAALKELAGLLQQHGERVVAVEGHCDERGTSAYNLTLGEKRAKSVQQYLESQGAAATQIQVTSFGKERPVCTDHSNACWQKNRRAHVRVQ